MDIRNLSNKEKKALHIAFVSESCLTFEEENGYGQMDVCIQENGSISIQSTREEATYLSNEQRKYLAEWMTYSR